MNKVFVFLGPTLDKETAAQLLPAVYLPPVGQGDVARLCGASPSAIAIVDGYFDRVPAVWHKEILWALHQGIPVFGSSSMGALRAAELANFGMCGVGEIFTRYRDGSYEDDDEVAVLHAAAEQGYKSLSDAMVNIRVTLAAAERCNVVSGPTARALLEFAKSLHYADRSYARVLRGAERLGLDPTELTRFARWLPDGKVDQKRLDALELLRVLRDHQTNGFPTPPTTEAFANTDAWQELQQRSAAVRGADETDFPMAYEALVDELILEESFPTARDGGIRRALGLALANQQLTPVTLDAEAVQASSVEFRRERSLLTAAAFEEWLHEQRLSTDESLSRFFTDDAKLRWSLASYARDLAPHLIGHLRALGTFGRLAQRAEAKLKAFEGTLPRTLEQSGCTETELWAWFFAERVQRTLPGDVDEYIRVRHELERERVLLALIRDYRYSQMISRAERRAAVGSDKPLV